MSVIFDNNGNLGEWMSDGFFSLHLKIWWWEWDAILFYAIFVTIMYYICKKCGGFQHRSVCMQKV